MEKPQPNPKNFSRLKISALIILWLSLAVAGLSLISDYKGTPGVAAATPPARFPATSRIKPEAGRPTLVMLAHPHCPCTRASLGELERLMAQTENRAAAYVLFLKPPGFADGWEKTDLWETASAIPGVKAVLDADGKEAELFKAATSGQIFLYDAAEQLIFKGGITGARGHAGDNAGRDAVVALINKTEATKTEATQTQAAQSETAVYGCPLFSRNSACPMPE
jgi:hypothetical protein